MRKTINTLVGLMLGAIIGATLMWAYAAEPEPVTVYVPVQSSVVDCPQEDSCTADYRDHAWHIEPDGGVDQG